jgi:hypothetical protein
MPVPKKRSQTAELSYLAGEVHALITFAQAAACALTVGQSLRLHFQVAKEAGLGNIAGLPVDDEVIDGYEFAADQISAALANPVKIG